MLDHGYFCFEPNTTNTSMFFCYILKCNDNSFYVGVTDDPVQRVCYHNEGNGSFILCSKEHEVRGAQSNKKLLTDNPSLSSPGLVCLRISRTISLAAGRQDYLQSPACRRAPDNYLSFRGMSRSAAFKQAPLFVKCAKTEHSV